VVLRRAGAIYLWDNLRGVAVGLHPDRYELRPKDEHIYAAPDGSGWVARGESRMSVRFHYEVVDRVTGAKVMDDVATLECADQPAETPALPPLPALPERGARRLPWEIDVRMTLPGGMIASSGGLQEESTGLVLSIGKYVSPQWYVGVSGKGSMIMGITDEAFVGLAQAGAEVRYTFHELTTSRRSRKVSAALWLGMRGGASAKSRSGGSPA
jgi:hypothetical protein